MKKTFQRNLVKVLALAGLLQASAAFALPAFPTSGSCAVLSTEPLPLTTTFPTTAQYNVLAIYTFTSATGGTAVGIGVNATYPGGGGATGTPAAPVISSTTVRSTPTPFTMAPDPQIPGAMDITLQDAYPKTFMAVPVNGGNTLLIIATGGTGSPAPASAVCQF